MLRAIHTVGFQVTWTGDAATMADQNARLRNHWQSRMRSMGGRMLLEVSTATFAVVPRPSRRRGPTLIARSSCVRPVASRANYCVAILIRPSDAPRTGVFIRCPSDLRNDGRRSKSVEAMAAPPLGPSRHWYHARACRTSFVIPCRVGYQSTP